MFQKIKRPIRFYSNEPITELRPTTTVIDDDGSKTTSFAEVDVMQDSIPDYNAVTLEQQLQAGVPLYPVDCKLLDGDSSALLDKINTDETKNKE